jgi:2-hydroxychromene-2-carboxylate isomerase
LPASISATLHTDPGCPWAYSALPALRVLDWRYGHQIDWRVVVIGLTERAEQYLARGYTPGRSVESQIVFRERFGMPFSLVPKARVAATARACRAIVAARLADPGSEWAVLRALQLANFTTPLLLDDDGLLAAALRGVPGVDADALVARLDDREVTEAYERDRAEARTAAGSASLLQGKTADTDGSVRYTAPSLVLEAGGRRLEAGGWQPVEAYDVLVANLDPGLRREPAPEGPEPLLRRYPEGLTTQEVAALLVHDNDALDRTGAEMALQRLVAAGRAIKTPMGHDAVWTIAGTPPGVAAPALSSAGRAPSASGSSGRRPVPAT